MLVIFTIASRNHLHRARALLASVAAHVPEASRALVLADSAESYFDPRAEPFKIIAGESLGLTNYRNLAFAMDAMTLCCLLKPVAASHLIGTGASKVIYLDSDSLLYARPDALLAALDERPHLLSPHLLSAAQNSAMAVTTMRSGAFNGGLFAVNDSEPARRFLAWWQANTSSPQKMRVEWSHDQGWLNHVPALFPEGVILRHPGYNVACWNLHEREVVGNASAARVNGEPLVMFHFSHFDRHLPRALTGRLQTSFAAPNDTVQALLADYAEKLASSGADTCERWPYEYGCFSDGKRIRAEHRYYFQDRIAAHLPAGADPFDANLRVKGFGGLTSLYHADHAATRLIRTWRQAARRS